MKTNYINPETAVIPSNTAAVCRCGQSAALRLLDPAGFYVTWLYCSHCFNNAPYKQQWTDSQILNQYAELISKTTGEDAAYLWELFGDFYVELCDGQVITLDDDRSIEDPYFPLRVDVYYVKASPFVSSGFAYSLDEAIGLAKQFTTEDILNDTYTGHHFVAYTDQLTKKTYTHRIDE
jgi:hypothetical protein